MQKMIIMFPDLRMLIRFLFMTPAIIQLLVFVPASMGQASGSAIHIVIPRVIDAPSIDDFRTMAPGNRIHGQMVKIEGFLQTAPSDGKPSSQQTIVYLGYDQKNLYAVFVAFDSEPAKVRGTMARRENIDDNDDWVELVLDTFHDRRRAYLFDCNALGVQWDALYQEDQGENASFDTLWHSQGRRTDRGFIVWMAIPFRSLRFPDAATQTWGIQFRRHISRIPEQSAWPHISSRVRGRLNQAGTASGLENISPGRNVQLIPYANFRSFRALDDRDAARPYFRQVGGEFDAGLDAKVVFKDRMVLDATVNPDFSQVESDDPQVTVNQRFEVFFPEKRPFFMENANYFETPINLVFTRRIADPQFGGRLTGKAGPYAVGAMLMDDQAPGKRVLEGDPAYDQRAKYGIVHISRDILNQSSVGLIYTDREFMGTYNRIAGVDANFRLGRNWTTTFQGATSRSRAGEGNTLAGPAYAARIARSGRQLNFSALYDDIGEHFIASAGFVNRTGFRQVQETLTYRFRPEGRILIAWGPDLSHSMLWDRGGIRLDSGFSPALNMELTGQTRIRVYYATARERLRPQDFPSLTESRDFGKKGWGTRISSSYFQKLSFSLGWVRESAVNVVPNRGEEPGLANRTQVNVQMNLRPITPLRIVNYYILSRLSDRRIQAGIFNNHIARSSWNWQLDRRLSLRLILQYDSLLGNPAMTRLSTNRNFNADFLVTYLINPGTAFFIGYNSNLQDINLVPYDDGSAIVPNAGRFINDGRQFFFKLSYLYRF